MFKRILATTAVGGILVASSIGAASALNVQGGPEQAGSLYELSCDNKVTVDFRNDIKDLKATKVVVSDIDKDCKGEDLRLALIDERHGPDKILFEDTERISGYGYGDRTVEFWLGHKGVDIKDIDRVNLIIEND